MGWLADLRRRLATAFHPPWDDEPVRLLVMPLEQRRVLSVTTVSAGADLVVDEGSVIELLDAWYQDSAGPKNSPHDATVNWDDGTTNTAKPHPPVGEVGSISAEHAFADNGEYHPLVTVTGYDGTSATSDGTTTITVRNVAPTLTVVGDQTVDEGATLALTDIGTFTDPGFGATEVSDYWIDWGDGTAIDTGTPTIDTIGEPGTPTAGSFDGSHVYSDDGVYTVTVTVADKDGGTDTGTFVVTVENTSPTVDAGGDATVLEGSLFTDSGSVTDPGGDVWEATVDYGDGSGSQTLVLSPTGSFDLNHTYADDGLYTVTVTVYDGGGSYSDSLEVTVENVAPSLTVVGDQIVDEGATLSLTDLGTFTDPGFGPTETFTYTINWGDGTATDGGTATIDVAGGAGQETSGSFDGSHVYADNGVYSVEVTVYDDDGGSDVKTFVVTVNNVAPTLAVVGDQTVDEGATLSLTDLGTFTDPGFGSTETFTYTINWGDGTYADGGLATIDVAGYAGQETSGSFDGSHVYADNGVYTVEVTVYDDEGGSDVKTFVVTVNNVAPTLAVVGDQTVDEGATLSLTDLGTFTDPGFGPTETFTYTINWGDGTYVDGGLATIDMAGGAGQETIGSFDGSHVYADNGVYTVEVTVYDDDGGSDVKTFVVTVNNVAPTLAVVGDQTVDEGATLSLTDLGTFTDPGFGATETFTYTINWGDGTYADGGLATIDVAGGAGQETVGSFDGSHVYADNGVYTVEVTVYDDDGGSDVKTFEVTVNNVVPSVVGVTGSEWVDEGAAFSLADLGWSIADPGFDNPSGGTTETFTSTYTIDWDDGTAPETGAIVNRVSGSPGVATVAEFEEIDHTYADNGVFTVSITFGDDDSPPVTYTFQITVGNVVPTVTPADDQTVEEGALLSVVDIATFTDPGFDNPDCSSGATCETFSYEINWGDGTAIDTGEATIDVPGSVGTDTSGSFDGSHVYADNGIYTVTLTVIDDDEGTTSATMQVTVLNVDPTILTYDDNDVNSLGQVTVEGDFSDPGYDNPLNPLSPPDGSVESFTVVIDWADGTSDTLVLGGSTPLYFTATHTYYAPPDPLNPAADIPIVVTVIDDDGGSDSAITYAEVPGEGVEFVYIDTTPMVPRLVFPRPVQLDAGGAGGGASDFLLGSAEFESARPDSSAAAENYLVLRTVLPDGRESADYRMPENALDRLPKILARLPDNRYRVYEIQADGPQRLVRDVFVRQHRVVDQTDASEGMEERPPEAQSVPRQDEAPPADEGAETVPDSAWQQWESRYAVPGDQASDGGQPAKSAETAGSLTTAGSPALGVAWLVHRLRANREENAERRRECFADWESCRSEPRHAGPGKPR